MPGSRDFGVLFVRVGVGVTLAAHGAQKLLGWFGGAGLEQTAAGFEAMGFRPGRLNAIAAGTAEIGSGLLLAAGLATPVAGAAAAGTMVVASAVHGPQGFFASKGGYEYSALLGLTAAGVGIAGPGRISLDQRTGDRFNRGWMKLVAMASVAPAATYMIYRRRQAPSAAVAEPEPASQAAES